MRELRVQTSEGVELRLEIAGAASRLAACLLDLVLIVAGLLSLLLLLQVLELTTGAVPDLGLGVLAGGAPLLVVGYFASYHIAWEGETPGKRALGLVVVSADGGPPSGGQCVLRSILWFVDALVFVPAPLGLLLAAATPRTQRLGDLAAGTLVLRRRARSGRTVEPWPDESWSTRETKELDLTPGLAVRLTDEDVAFLRDLITRSSVDPDARSRQLQLAVQHYARRLGFEPAPNVRRTLKELYLFVREMRASR